MRFDRAKPVSRGNRRFTRRALRSKGQYTDPDGEKYPFVGAMCPKDQIRIREGELP